MSGSCNDCGNVMCLCDSEGDDFEGVLSNGIIISNERYEKLIDEIQSRDAEIVRLREELENFAYDIQESNIENCDECCNGELLALARKEIEKRDAEIELYSNAFKTADELRISSAERYDKEIEELKSLIKEATPWVTCVKEITELPEYRQAIAIKVLIEWLKKAEKIK